MAINNNPEFVVAYTMMRCSNLPKEKLKRLTGEERILIAKMRRFLQSKDDTDAPLPSEINKLTTHLKRIELNNKKVFFITAIFRDFVQSRNYTLTELNSGKKFAEELIAKDLFNQLTVISKEKIVDNSNYTKLKADALAGDGYAISFLKRILEEKNIVDPNVPIAKLYQEALNKNHPAIVESEMYFWTYVATGETFKSDFTEEKLLQIFNYIPSSKFNTDPDTTVMMLMLCKKVMNTNKIESFRGSTRKLIENFQKSYEKPLK